MAHNLLALAERAPALIHAHNGHLQRAKSTMRMGGMPLEWWSAGALVSAQLGEEYAFVATALGTIRHQGVDTPLPDTVEGLLYALPEDRCVIDAPRLVIPLGDTPPLSRVSPGAATPAGPGPLGGSDGSVFVEGRPTDPFRHVGARKVTLAALGAHGLMARMSRHATRPVVIHGAGTRSRRPARRRARIRRGWCCD